MAVAIALFKVWFHCAGIGRPIGKRVVLCYVEVKRPIPEKPAYLEVHFYPDGHVEGAISGDDGPSAPHLMLERRLPYVR
jgi:hypothetical protein